MNGEIHTENADHAGEYKQWTFGGFVLGLLAASIFCTMFWVGGPRFVTLNDGEIIETVLRAWKWVEVDEKTTKIKPKGKYTTRKPATMWGKDCGTSGGSGFNPNDPNIKGE